MEEAPDGCPMVLVVLDLGHIQQTANLGPQPSLRTRPVSLRRRSQLALRPWIHGHKSKYCRYHAHEHLCRITEVFRCFPQFIQTKSEVLT
jgi:hypothetical protein